MSTLNPVPTSPLTNHIAIIGAGRIGCMLSEKLLSKGYKITLFNRPGSPHEQEIQNNVRVLQEKFPVEQFAFVRNLSQIEGCDIIHYVIGEALDINADFKGAPVDDMPGRVGLLVDHAKIAIPYIRQLLPKNPKAVIVNISNPVDPLTHLMAKVAQANKYRNLIIGMGSALDSTRLHNILIKFAQEKLGLEAPRVAGALVLGEHGYGLVPILSKAKINGKPLLELITKEDIDEIRRRTQHRPWEIIKETKHTDVEAPVQELVKLTDALLSAKSPTLLPYTGPTLGSDGQMIYAGKLGIFCNRNVYPLTVACNPSEMIALRGGVERLAKEWNSFLEKNSKDYPEVLEMGRHWNEQRYVTQ